MYCGKQVPCMLMDDWKRWVLEQIANVALPLQQMMESKLLFQFTLAVNVPHEASFPSESLELYPK